MNQDHDDHNRHTGLIVDNKVLDFILYEKITKNDQKKSGGKGGCLGMVTLLLLPAASLMLLYWK
ncbi:MAG: hypothetical protein JZU65_17290 [Chlorobium sp.]|jgi:hypothetical protein|nr:hypothetical protein [Chlorobium sp.]